MSVLPEILQWSGGRPLWQRDALRRLVEGASLTAEDVDALARILQASKGVPLSEPAPAAEPLAEKHLALPLAGDAPVVLEGLHDLSNVNALAPKQSLTFNATGITVVYGDNGAGKSGYVRVLKRLCRARAPGDAILGNLFTKNGDAPSGTIAYRVGATPHEMPWSDGVTPPAELAAVSVFDSACASVYVEKESPVAYRPLGLDLLAKLAAACDAIKRVLLDQISKLDANKLVPLGYSIDGPVTRLLNTLTRSTSREEIEAVALLSSAERERMNQLRLQIAELDLDGPRKRALESRNKAARLRAVGGEMTTIGQALAAEPEAALRAAHATNAEAASAAALASALTFKDQPLPSVGVSAWRSLWEAARDYSTGFAYKGLSFPQIAENAVCVLCQQPLTEEGRERLLAFERFVRDRSQQQATVAAATLAGLQVKLDTCPVSLTSPLLLDDLGPVGSPVRDAVDT